MNDGKPPGDGEAWDDMLWVPLHPGDHELVDPGNPELFTLADLRAAHRLFGDEKETHAYLDDLEGKRLHGPDMAWSEGSLLMVAHVSAELRERIRRHLGLSQEEMTARMNQLRPSQS